MRKLSYPFIKGNTVYRLIVAWWSIEKEQEEVNWWKSAIKSLIIYISYYEYQLDDILHQQGGHWGFDWFLIEFFKNQDQYPVRLVAMMSIYHFVAWETMHNYYLIKIMEEKTVEETYLTHFLVSSLLQQSIVHIDVVD